MTDYLGSRYVETMSNRLREDADPGDMRDAIAALVVLARHLDPVTCVVDVTASRLAEALRMDQADVSRLMALLERVGGIERGKPGEGVRDRRVRQIRVPEEWCTDFRETAA